MKKLLIALVGVALMTSCLKGSYKSDYTATCSFEFSEAFSDSLYYKTYFSDGGFVFNSFRNNADEIPGGFMISMKCDPVYKAGHVSRSPYCVADTTALGKCFLVFRQLDDKSMPEHDIIFISTEIGAALPKLCYINNTNEVANIAKFGKGEIPAFAEGDYLKMTISATLNNNVKDAKVEAYLAKYEGSLKVITDWKLVDLNPLGDFDSLDIVLSSNRTDIPMNFCMDEFVARVSIAQ